MFAGMKNFLVKNGDGELLQLIDEESHKLRENEFINVDAVLEVRLNSRICLV